MNKLLYTWGVRSIWAVCISAFVVVACSKEVEPDPGQEPEYSPEATAAASTASVAYDDISVTVEGAYEGWYTGKAQGCVVITVDSVAPNTYEVTLDFGTGCTDAQGNVRSGIVIATLSTPRHSPGATTDIEFNGYTYNGTQVDGNYLQTFTGLNPSGQPEWVVDIDGSLVYAPGDTLFYMSNRIRTWIDGFNPFSPADIKMSLVGSADGERTGQLPWTMSVGDPLVWHIGCPWAVQGNFDMTVTSLPLYTVDFGNGTCDDQATVSANGVTINITL